MADFIIHPLSTTRRLVRQLARKRQTAVKAWPYMARGEEEEEEEEEGNASHQLASLEIVGLRRRCRSLSP